MEIKIFIEELEKLRINITEEQLQQLDSYYHLLITWNEKMNLTGITEKKDVYLKHFYDSATLNKSIDLTSIKSLCDIGTGAGFPGLVLKILYPNLSVTLVDSLQKRTIFLKTVIEELKLTNCIVLHERAEEYGKKVREQFDVVTSRAVAPLSILMEYSIPLVKVGGHFIPMKGHCEEELQKTNKALQILHSKLVKKDCFLLPIENSTRTILKFQKEKETSLKYPRKYGDIKNKSL
ncbi:MAG: 16S rRNA (guanine(527)-N(7))-methyltransferase RsmG [Bacilli bacterium]|nr:16S rRNA (guanine(527)-N(7))-methyltransferase RsmG [Bacilli bacterium]